MKEIMAIIRPAKDRATKEALARIGCSGLSTLRVLGRGRQRGLSYRAPQDEGLKTSEPALMRYLPKKMIHMVVTDQEAKPVVDTIIQVNRTGQYGDGRIFVLDVDEAYLIRTGEQGVSVIR